MAIAGMYGMAYASMLTAATKFGYTADTVVCILCDNTYTPDQNVDQFIGDLVGEIGDVSYARQNVTGKTLTYSGVTRTLTLDCNDVTFAGLTATDVKYAVWAVDLGADEASPLLCYWDFQANLNPSNNDLKLTINAAGLITMTVAAAA